MGQLIDGQWSDTDLREYAADGSFVRSASPWRRWIDSAPGSTFPAASGRYHLFVNMGCPWAWRAVLYRALKGLEGVISMSCTQPGAGPHGWTFLNAHGQSSDTLLGVAHLHEVYARADARFTGRITVPVLWDKQQQTIVNNESADIIRMFDSAFDAFTDHADRYCPPELEGAIDTLNVELYSNVNNGVYRCGFARTQAAYEAAYDSLFATLDALELRLSGSRYLLGARITEPDWRLLSTLLRFDSAYYSRFRCNRQRLVDYPNLWAYARDLYQQPRVAAAVDTDAIKGIYWSASGIIPKGPVDDWTAPHGREVLSRAA